MGNSVWYLPVRNCQHRMLFEKVAKIKKTGTVFLLSNVVAAAILLMAVCFVCSFLLHSCSA